MMSFYLIKSLYANDFYALQGYCFSKIRDLEWHKGFRVCFSKEITSKLFVFQSFLYFCIINLNEENPVF